MAEALGQAVVETSDLKMTAVLSAPAELVALLRQIVDLYNNGHQAVTLQALQATILRLQEQASTEETLLVTDDEDAETTFLKSWSDILSVEVYVDTEIYAPADPPELEYQQAATDYLQSWQTIAQQLGRTPLPPQSQARLPRLRVCDRPPIRQRRFV